MFRVWAVSAGRQPPAAPPLLRRRLSAPESGRRFQERENTPIIAPHEKSFLYFSLKARIALKIQDFAFVCAAFYCAQCLYTLTLYNMFIMHFIVVSLLFTVCVAKNM